jgi:hypothetical protein
MNQLAIDDNLGRSEQAGGVDRGGRPAL